MGFDANKIIEWAKKQVGCKEDPIGSNKQKYGAFLDATTWYEYKQGEKTWIHKVNGYNWCTQFFDCAFVDCFGIENARKILNRPRYNNYGAVVKYSYNYLAALDRVGKTPVKGGAIYFKNSEGLSHIGIVIDFDATTVTTIEGNTGKDSAYVCQKTYNRQAGNIAGYGYPVFSAVPEEGYKPGEIYTVQCKGPLRIRTGASTDNAIIDNLFRGDHVKCEEVVKEGKNTWLKISGYVCADYNGEVYIS